MAVEYTDLNKFKALAHILEDYTEWFARIALLVAYTAEETIHDGYQIPSSFNNWVNSKNVKTEFNSNVIKPIIDIHEVMLISASHIIDSLNSKKYVGHNDFVEFKNLFSSFLSSVRRLEIDSALEGDGTDEETGLRPVSAIKYDLDKEMQRLSRNGNPFSLSMLRVDGFPLLDQPHDALRITSLNIKKCMRPFDDAYYIEDGYFLLSLKHADMVGAEAAAMRIIQSLNEDEENVMDITVSFCLSEPVNGDDIDVLLNNMHVDLNNHIDTKETILKFLDISPLERFIGLKK